MQNRSGPKDPIPNRVMSPTTDASWEVEVSEKTGRPVRWNGQNFPYNKKLMEVAARKKDPDLYKVMTQQIKYNASFTTLQQSALDGRQLDLQELIFSSVCTDMGQQLMDMEETQGKTQDSRYDCGQCSIQWNAGVVTPLQRAIDRLRGFVDAGMDCVDTPEKVVAMAVTFDKANQADEQWHRSYGAKQHPGQQNKSGGGQGKGRYEKASSKGQGKSLSCFVCGSTDHLKAGCPDKAKKQSGDEAMRVPRGNCTLRQDDHTSPVVALSDEGIVADGVVTGITVLTRTEESQGDNSRDDQEGEDTEVIQEADHQATMDAMEAGCSWWYFDTASNSHVTGARSHFITFTENTANARNVRGLSPSIISRIADMGTVALVNEVNGEDVTMYIDDVFYVPDAEYGLFSPGLAYEQGFEFDFNQATWNFVISWEGRRVVVAKLHEATWGFQASSTSRYAAVGPEDQPLANYTIAEGVGTLPRWHERMGHICPQYLKTMVDKGLVQGMMLTQRQKDMCDACRVGKQKMKEHRKKLDRATKEPNQVVYADLLFPGKGNGSRFEAVLVIMDGYSRFVKVHMLKDKSSEAVNNYLKEYVLWTERQAIRMIKRGIPYTVKQVLTDKGGEFVNEAMEAWYNSRGIEYIQVGPKSSQLNLCERTHQTLVEMTKAMMEHSGLPRSLWPEAMRNAVYIKNRSYNKGTQGVPYEMFFGAKPDVHHIRQYGSLASVHVPVTPGRRKHYSNAKLGYVLGYAENVVGYKVYFPTEHTAKFVSDLRVADGIGNRDRHEVDGDEVDWSSLNFSTKEQNVEHGVDNENTEMITVAASKEGETNREQSLGLEVGENDALQEDEELADDEELQVGVEPMGEDHESRGHHDEVVAEDEQLQDELRCEAPASNADTAEDDDAESMAGLCGSSEDSEDLEAEEEKGNASDEDVTVASVFAEDESGRDNHVTSGLEEDTEEVNTPNGGESNTEEKIDASAMIPQTTCRTGKRTHRSETLSEAKRVEEGANKPQTKRTRTGLREYHERRRPKRLDDFVVNLSLQNQRVLDKNGRPIRANQVKIPRNRREMLRSKWREFFLMAEMEEMTLLKTKGVIEEIPDDEVPEDAKPVNTMWVYALKSDQPGYVVRFKARIVALGNYQRPGIDFHETFAPVARMSSFRLLMAIAAELELDVYGGDINTAYLNAKLEIRQYLRPITGYPCQVNGHLYAVHKALYGLHQSGQEWNSELNQWFLDQGYQRSLTEPCLYFKVEGETIMYVLGYVDDILAATNDEAYKEQLFKHLNNAYGLKDQGLLKQYLGVEVEQTRESIKINQGKYAREILKQFRYQNAHAVGNPMETNVRLAPLEIDEKSETCFQYREAIGMLMYLATSTRPDLAFTLGQLSRFVANPSVKNVGAVKRVLRYLVVTLAYGITYSRKQNDVEIVLEGYSDSDWANDPEQRKSTTGFVFSLAGGAIAWVSRRQSIIALSTAEAEYVAACEASMEAMSESNILQETMPKSPIKLRIGIDKI
ncbi:unnamed protein product [Phytophthora fragariaefolia]|uniref:Unnamed protein product n=1 Tax=Phytophthora fragariaefolia TaxID=1490495 RepID=A0A9W6XTT8_9STRA|nr:unnamed protein product [Phytophthora fragariaefolia]